MFMLKWGVNMQKALEKYEEYLLEKNRGQATIQAYLKDIENFIKCFEFDNWAIIENKHIKEYVNLQLEKGKSPSTINRALISITGISKFLKLDVEPSLYRVKEQNQDSLKDKLTINDFSKILYYAEQAEDIRTVTLLKTLVLTGARISEALQIEIADINKTKIKIKGKGSKYRDLLIPKALKKQFKEYAAVRIQKGDSLFTGERGAINRQTAFNDIKKYAAMGKMKKSLAHPHAFRHLYAYLLKEQGVNVVDIKQLMGHSLSVTEHYMSSDQKKLLDVIDTIEKGIPKYTPVSKRSSTKSKKR